MTQVHLKGNVLSQWVPVGAVLLALGASFSVGAVYSQLSTKVDAHVKLEAHPRVMDELAAIKVMVARIDERTKSGEPKRDIRD